jgi:hypothetical protein
MDPVILMALVIVDSVALHPKGEKKKILILLW